MARLILENGFYQAWLRCPTALQKRGPQQAFTPGASRAVGAPSAWISLVGLRPRRARLRFSRRGNFTQGAKVFQVPWDTRGMPQKSLKLKGKDRPEGIAAASDGVDGWLQQCNILKRWRMMSLQGFHLPTNSQDEP